MTSDTSTSAPTLQEMEDFCDDVTGIEIYLSCASHAASKVHQRLNISTKLGTCHSGGTRQKELQSSIDSAIRMAEEVAEHLRKTKTLLSITESIAKDTNAVQGLTEMSLQRENANDRQD